jgi:hypothetical protein
MVNEAVNEAEPFRVPKQAMELYSLFSDKWFELAIVGGWVRDSLLGIESHDMDFATNAYPEDIKEIVSEWADEVWTSGEMFGTIAMLKNGQQIEITTYRADTYSGDSRKPEVNFGTSLVDDLRRRDFTINAMALKLPDEFIDPFNGVKDLNDKILRTPVSAETSIIDDPLRIYRAARFATKFDMELSPDLVTAISNLKGRLSIVSAERISAELEKLISSYIPWYGLQILIDYGVIQDMSSDILLWLMIENSSVSLALRFAAVYARHHSGGEAAAKMRKQRFPNYLIRSVKSILDSYPFALCAGNDAEIRNFIRKSQGFTEECIMLAEAVYPFMEHGINIPDFDRIREIAASEDLSDPLDGREIMSLFNIDGKEVGEAIKEMRNLIDRNGPMSKDEMIFSLKLRYN